MTGLQIAGAVLMIIVSIAVILIVLIQKDRESSLSGAISGGDSSANGLFDKTKGKHKEAALEKGTKILAIIFFIIAIATTAIILFV